MTNTPGNNLVIVDSDALIGLINENDDLHERCVLVSRFLDQSNYVTVIPYPIVLEASTSLSRSINRPDLAKQLLQDYAQLEQPTLVELTVADRVAESFNPTSSKKNTPFDHYVAALAKLNHIDVIFSFDRFYEKQGLTLAKNLLGQQKNREDYLTKEWS